MSLTDLKSLAFRVVRMTWRALAWSAVAVWAVVRSAGRLLKPRRRPAEYRRTCGRCSNVWFIPRQAAREKAPRRMQMAAARMQKFGANASLVSFSRGRKAAEVARLEDRQRRVVENHRCPQCGSGQFAETAA